MRKSRGQLLRELACELLQVGEEDLFFRFRSRSHMGWYLEYERPRYPEDMGIPLGLNFDKAKAELINLLGEQ